MNFIELTDTDNKPRLINLDNVTTIFSARKGTTCLEFNASDSGGVMSDVFVKETMEEIKQKIYRLNNGLTEVV